MAKIKIYIFALLMQNFIELYELLLRHNALLTILLRNAYSAARHSIFRK